MQRFFRSSFSENIFKQKYLHEGCETWDSLADTLVEDVCEDHLPADEKEELKRMITNMEFLPGGRYLYYAGRPNKFFNNCFLLKSEEDTREDWAELSWKSEMCLMTGGGIGNDYSVYRPKGSLIRRTGGTASGTISKMSMINEIGRRVMQGGSRRSAIYASLNWQHGDVEEFLHSKDWYNMPIAGTGMTIGDVKEKDFNFPAPLDMTNISLNYDNKFLEQIRENPHYCWATKDMPEPFNPDLPEVFIRNVRQALKTGEPGFSFNFYDQENETLRNAPVSGNTHVLTNQGYVKVKKLANQPSTIWTGKRWANNVIFKKTGKNKETVTVRFTGDREITCEPWHEFFVERYSGKGKRRTLDKIEKVKAENLKPGNVLHVSLPHTPKKRFNQITYTLGWLYGDGSFNCENSTAELTLCSEESKDCLPYITGYDTITKEDGRGYTRIYWNKHEKWSDRSKEKYPDDGLDPSFIAGLFDSDGNFEESQKKIRLSSKNREFLHDVRRALEYYGILSSVCKNGFSTYGGTQTYQLVIMSDYLHKFKKYIPVKRLKIDLNGYESYRPSLIKVISVQKSKKQDVYCADVKYPEHSFQAEGVIIANCTEVTSEDDSDVCNLGSINLANIESKERLDEVVGLASKFLLLGTLKADLPYEKIARVREKNRRLGLGLMGVHEWLLKRGYRYEVVPELREWLEIYRDTSEKSPTQLANKLGISVPVAFRAIAPTGSIGILAGTTTGIEPLFAVSYKRRYLKGDADWHFEYVVDGTAKILIEQLGVNPETIESAIDLASDPERRIKFQADIQDYVDMAISSTINIPAWGTPGNNELKVRDFAKTLAKYAHRLRGFTVYPNGARGGQPLTSVSYNEAKANEGRVFKEEYNDICEITGGGTCGE